MNVALVDFNWKDFLPLCFGRPISHLLVGIDSLAEKWKRIGATGIHCISAPHLMEKYGSLQKPDVLLNASVVPSAQLWEEILKLRLGQCLTYRAQVVAVRIGDSILQELPQKIASGAEISVQDFDAEEIFYNHELTVLKSFTDIFAYNDDILRTDFESITKGFKTTQFSSGVVTRGDDIYIHPEAKVFDAVLNSETGPIYIDANAEVMEGTLIRGPFSIGESSMLKMGAKVYGATSIGKHCKVGGEINNSVLNDYSNKGHDGFLGNSVIGSWCNLGADTNTSNLKNNYGEVKVWNYRTAKFENSRRLFHGLIMGDHSKAGINTMFNTGTVTGMFANIFDSGFPPKFIPSFSWGSPRSGFVEFKINKAIEAAKAMMSRRGIELTNQDEAIYKAVAEMDAIYRNEE